MRSCSTFNKGQSTYQRKAEQNWNKVDNEGESWWLLTPERFLGFMMCLPTSNETRWRTWLKQNPNSPKHKRSHTHRNPLSHIQQLSRKTNQAGSVAQHSVTPTWWDHFANSPASTVLPVEYTEGCCGSCSPGLCPFPRPQAGAVGAHCPPRQPFTGVSHPAVHRSLWAGMAALASWSPARAELGCMRG